MPQLHALGRGGQCETRWCGGDGILLYPAAWEGRKLTTQAWAGEGGSVELT